MQHSDKFEEYIKKLDEKRALLKAELERLENTYSFMKAPIDPKNAISEYLIHDNGGRPYKITFTGATANIYKITTGKDFYEPDPLISITNIDGFWYGFDASIYKENGNTILIKRDNNYYYISHSIKLFTINETILDYISPIGNNDVPYPVIYGEEYVYFPDEQYKVKKTEIPIPVTIANAEEIYGIFYGHIKEYDKLPVVEHMADETIISRVNY